MTSNPSSADIHDLSDLHELTEETVLDCIRERFQRNIIYTYIGDVLVAVNPFKELPLYDRKHHELYKNVTARKQNSPHVFWVAGNAFRNLVESRKDRCIIVGGISGAGKTESTKHIFEHILHHGGNYHPNLVENLKEINPLLELFGNSLTRLNDNSSRFGKLIGLQYDGQGGLIKANISCYMLEKSRVIRQHDLERNFHIFYAFTQGIPEDKLRALGVSRETLYDSKIIDRHDKKPGDEKALANARRIMQKVGFTDQHIEDMHRILAAILVVANVKFTEEESTGRTVLREKSEKETIPIVCRLLRIADKDELIQALTSNTSYTQKGERITSRKNIQRANDGREAFAKSLYSRLFDALVGKMNEFLKRAGQKGRDSQFAYELSILDISGFENLTDPRDRNSYEQLLINITNERMHKFFLKKVLKAELETYAREGVHCEDLPDASRLDNKSTIELLIKSNLGVIRILEDFTTTPGVTDEGFVHKLRTNNQERAEFSFNPRDNCTFRIRHYAGKVEYDARGFLDKNRDTMTSDLISCLENSNNIFITRTSSRGDEGRLQGFVSHGFKKSLRSLVNKLKKSETVFVRCIKSNERQAADRFDEVFVKEQLLRSGVLDIARLRKQGFPVRILYGEFLERFGIICQRGSHLSQEQMVEHVLRVASVTEYRMGKSLVFMKYDSLDCLEKRKAEIERQKKEEEEDRKRREELEEERKKRQETPDALKFNKDKIGKGSTNSSMYQSLRASSTRSGSYAYMESIAKKSGKLLQEEEDQEREPEKKDTQENPKEEKMETDPETLAFDSFRQVEDQEEETNNIEDHVLPAARLFMFLCLFVLVLGSGTAVKLLFRSLIDDYKADRKNTKNTMNLLVCICVPPAITLLASIIKALFGSARPLDMKYLTMVVLIGVLHMLGVGMLIFNILPELDAFRGNMVLLNVAVVPSFMSFLIKFKCSKGVSRRRILSVLRPTIALLTQVGGVICALMFIITRDVLPHMDDGGIFKLRLMFPIAVILISLEWWENFLYGRMAALKSFRDRGARTKTDVIVVVAKLVTIVCFALLLANHDVFQTKRAARNEQTGSNGSVPEVNSTRTKNVPVSLSNFTLRNDSVETFSNNAANATDEVRTFIYDASNYTCVTQNATGDLLVFSCSSANSTIDIFCPNGSLECSLSFSDLNTTVVDPLFEDHYRLLSESKMSVTFTNSTNNITCDKRNEPEGQIYLFCKNYGFELELLCEAKYTGCERIFVRKEPTLLQRIEDFWEKNYVVLCTLFLSIVFPYCSVLACKLHMQQFSFSLAIILISPLTSVLMYLNCSDILSFRGIIPDVTSCTPMDIESIKMSIGQGAGLWIGIVLLTYYIWIPRYERMAKIERLFVEPLKDCVFIDVNILLRCKHDDPPSEPDANSKSKCVPDVKVCATMWHETQLEMSQLLKSLYRLDMHHAARVHAEKKSGNTDPDSFTLEIHIIFDDAFTTETKNGKKIKMPNSYVMRFLECNERAVRDIAQCGPSEYEIVPQKKQTPFGAQLDITMPGGTKLLVHLKDKTKIRHRKRWSQILYLYYLLGFKTFGMQKLKDILKKPADTGASLFAFLKPEYQEQMRNTFFLTLDGDVDFQPDAVILLLDRMKKNPKTGAVCGRIHPIGWGPMVWYQKFEYAIGHWLQKAAEHVMGCVLCCPGCFSLFRASALMDDNVMNTYTTKPTVARHYIQFEQGEDRWLCTLLLQRGHKIDYEAGADALTYAPETFNDFFVQRRRWAPSTMANIMDLIGSWKSTCKRNDNISSLFMIYECVMLFSSLLAPATVTLMIAGSYASVLNLDASSSFYLSVLPVALFVIVCLKCKNDTQLNVAALLCSLYTLIMVIVTVGTILNIVNDDIFSPNVVFLVGLGIIFTCAGLWHPKEIACLFHGLLYYFTVPSTFIFLTIYFLCNLNNVSWGTREGNKVAAEASQDETNLGVNANTTFLGRLVTLIRGTFCEELIEAVSKGSKENAKPSNPPNASIANGEGIEQDYIDETTWMNRGEFEKGEKLICSEEEEQFWKSILKKYLYPLDNDHEHQELIKTELASLRNNVVFAFFMLNFMFAVALLQLQLNREKILSFYILGKYEPVSVAFLTVFSILLVVQFISMILHRWGTFLHLISNCSRRNADQERFKNYYKECVGLLNGKSKNLKKSAELDGDSMTSEETVVKVDPEDTTLDDADRDTHEDREALPRPHTNDNLYDRRFHRNYRRAKATVAHRQRRLQRNNRGYGRLPINPEYDFYGIP